jgi:Arc/MetJ-type ribon-helix-helix transcriptional regulator
MRIHVHLDDALVEQVDARVGARGRSRFVADAVRRALDDAAAWDTMRSAVGSISDEGHPWDDDAAAWVTGERRADSGRVG